MSLESVKHREPGERDALGRFPKGSSGNPNGRPRKGHAMAEHLRFFLAMPIEQFKQINLGSPEYTAGELVAIRMVREAVNGDAKSQKLVMAYVEGLPPQKLTHTGEGAAGMVIVFPKEFDGV